MIAIIILAAASFAFFGVAAGIAVKSVLDPKDTLSAICTMTLLGLVALGLAGHRLQKSLPEPLPTPNTNFNQLP